MISTGVIFCIFVNIASAEKIALEKNSASAEESHSEYLSSKKTFFKYNPRVTSRNYCHEVNNVMMNFSRIENDIVDMLSNNNKSMFRNNSLYPLWGVIYANLPVVTGDSKSVNKVSVQYIFAQICATRYEDAKQNALKMLETDRENYSVFVMLGILSVQDKDLFCYLEKAYAMNPLKTIYIINWHADWLELQVPEDKEWDFINAYLHMLAKDVDTLRKLRPQSTTMYRLQDVTSSKYTSEFIRERGAELSDIQQMKIALDSIIQGK